MEYIKSIWNDIIAIGELIKIILDGIFDLFQIIGIVPSVIIIIGLIGSIPLLKELWDSL